jgi:DNA polymerase elongation subunit (family B)
VVRLWEQIKGQNLYTDIDWAPYVFLPTSGEVDIKSIFDQPMVKKTFNTFYEYKNFIKENPDSHENSVKPEIQFLAERYSGIPDEEIEIPTLKIYSIDIETSAENFTDAQEAKDPITLISIWDMTAWRATTFGVCDYTGNLPDITYVKCNNEKDLISRFLAYLKSNPFDVVTGWNCYAFDLPYIINRIFNLWGGETKIHNYLSPIHQVSMWTGAKVYDGSGRMMKGSEYKLDIGGVTILDYMDIYKRYGEKLESYSLNFVSSHELEKGKLDYSQEAINLRDLYLNNFDTFVEYNVIDAKRPAQLEKKLGFIQMIQTLSLLTKTPMYCYQTQNAQIEGLVLTYLKRHGQCAPGLTMGIKEDYEAAYVKEPRPGIYKWIADMDVMSEYPTAIITLNMSPETYFGKILDLKEEDIVRYTAARQFPVIKVKKPGDKIIEYDREKIITFNNALAAGKLSIAPNGAMFVTGKVGVLADVAFQLFAQRKKFKGKMNKLIKAGGNKNEINRLDKLQWTTKILLNSIYGILAIPYSRYANINIAEAVTACGRHIIKSGERFINDLLNNPNSELKVILEELKS